MKFLICITFSILAVQVYAQEFTLSQAGDGVLIELQENKQTGPIIIERAEENGRFKAIATLESPISARQLKDRLDELTPILPASRSTEIRSQALWGWLQSGRATHPFLNDPANLIGLGLAWYDTDIKPGKLYRYRIAGQTRDIQWQERVPFESRWILQEQIRHSPVADFKWFSTDGTMVDRIRVYRSQSGSADEQEIFPAWSVYHASGGDTIFTRMQDTMLQVEGQYSYRVEPLDRLGNRGQSFSTINYTYLKSDREPVVRKLDATEGKLSWELAFPERVRSLHLYRGHTFNGPYERIAVLKPDQRSFQDAGSTPMEGLFYYLVVNDVLGENRHSLIVHSIDKDVRSAYPPEQWQIAEIPEGIQLDWQNPLGSVRGFYVYRASGYRGAWELASSFIPASGQNHSWVDTSENLIPGQIYSYALATESESYQKSERSNSKSIRISVSEPVQSIHWIEASADNEQVSISWENLFARVPALAGYKLYRQYLDQENSPQLIAELDRNTNKYLDNSMGEPGQYAWTIIAVDLFGNQSSGSQPAIFNWTGKSVMAPEQVSAIKTRNGILIKWTAARNAERLQILRSEEQGDWLVLKDFPESTFEYLDTEIERGKKYQYKIIAISNGRAFEAAYPVLIRN
ncbi:MAG: hypothetical protein KDC34_20150 [Saprospiraceae bacterium]|nr:hypothetical protein [Saprospiraceae bacterium]